MVRHADHFDRVHHAVCRKAAVESVLAAQDGLAVVEHGIRPCAVAVGGRRIRCGGFDHACGAKRLDGRDGVGIGSHGMAPCCVACSSGCGRDFPLPVGAHRPAHMSLRSRKGVFHFGERLLMQKKPGRAHGRASLPFPLTRATIRRGKRDHARGIRKWLLVR